MLKALNPVSILGVSVAWLIAAMIVFDARFQAACILIPALLLVGLNGTSVRTLLVIMVPFGLFAIGIGSTTLLFHREGYAGQLAREALFATPAISAGTILILRTLACGMISSFFALTTDPGVLTRVLMARFGLPPRVGYALFAVLQLVPDLRQELHHMRLAQAMKTGRGLRRVPAPREIAKLVVSLLAFAIRRAGEVAIALEARGLGPGSLRTFAHVRPFRVGDLVFVLSALVIEGGLVAVVIG